MSKALDIGRKAESWAAEYLKQSGFKIVTKNFYSKMGEIDLIAQNREYIVFVEVKARRLGSMIKPVEAVGKSKRIKIIKTACYYMMKNPVNLQPRFDIIEVIVNNFFENVKEINHIENAFSQEDIYAVF